MITGRAPSVELPVDATGFEDIIDGYFPLQESLRQMLHRNGFVSACVTLTHAPIMNIPGLAPSAPVPLRIDQGDAGIADRLDIIAVRTRSGIQLSGYGRWLWYSGASFTENLLPSRTRLAEPAIVQGIGLADGGTHSKIFNQGGTWQQTDFVIFKMKQPFADGPRAKI